MEHEAPTDTAGQPAPPREDPRFAELARLSPDAILVHRDDRIEFANLAALDLFGVERVEALLGRSPLEWLHADDHPAIRGRIARHLSGEGVPGRHLATVVRADGTTRRVEAVASPFVDARGQALQVVLRDVTERLAAEAALAAAHQRTTDILESITDGFYAVDAAWRLTFVNRRAEALWGLSPALLLGRGLWEVFPAQRESPGGRALQEAMAERRAVRFEVRSALLDRWVETFAYPSADGGLSVFFSDITARHEREDQLQRVAEALPQLVWIADDDGRLRWFNQRWRDYTGQAPGAEAWEPALHPEDGPTVLALWGAARARGGGHEVEHRLRRADGQYRWFLRRSFRLRGDSGQPARWFGTCTDVHDLKVTAELLRQADRLKEDFLHMAAHEFRSPLTALRLQVAMLRRSALAPAPCPERLEHSLRVVDAQVDRLQVLLDTLLDVSRIGAGRLTLDLAEVDLAEVARQVAERMEPEAAEAGAPIRLELRPVTGRWDRARLDQVVTNLLSNAVKYGGRRPVTVAVAGDGEEALLLVRDQGIGIAADQLDLVFERYERAANAAHLQGLGLGLWITRKLVEAHQGAIRVESAPGAGTTFTVTLPRG